MNPFHGLLPKPHMPIVFNPKVTPHPSDSERLEARLLEAAQQLMQSRRDRSTRGGTYAARR